MNNEDADQMRKLLEVQVGCGLKLDSDDYGCGFLSINEIKPPAREGGNEYTVREVFTPKKHARRFEVRKKVGFVLTLNAIPVNKGDAHPHDHNLEATEFKVWESMTKRGRRQWFAEVEYQEKVTESYSIESTKRVEIKNSRGDVTGYQWVPHSYHVVNGKVVNPPDTKGDKWV